MIPPPQHVNPGLDTTINPVFTPDTYREQTAKPRTAIELLKIHVAWIEETSRNQLFDANAIGEMIEEAERRAGYIR